MKIRNLNLRAFQLLKNRIAREGGEKYQDTMVFW